MSFVPGPSAELRALLEALCEEQITPAQVARLEAIVLADPQAEEFYITYMTMQADLVRGSGEHAASLVIAGAVPEARAAIRPNAGIRSRWLWVPWMLGAAASVIAALTLSFSHLVPKPGSPPGGMLVQAPRQPDSGGVRLGSEDKGPLAAATQDNDPSEPTAGPRPVKGPGGLDVAEKSVEATSGGVAILTRGVNVVWESASTKPDIGAILATGPLKFRSGILQLEFYGGATVVMEGPAEIELKSIDEIVLRSGKLRAKVSPRSRGFRVRSPDLKLIDLGTEFGMEVLSGDKSEVHVFDGKVEISKTDSRSGSPAKWELTEGHGMRIGKGGEVTELAAQATSFLGQSELERLCLEESRRRYKQWLGRAGSLRNDPRMVTHFTFEADRDAGSRTLINQRDDRSMDGVIIGCDWVDGRWPGKGALEFKRPSDRVRIHIPGEFESLTLAAWVRIDAIENRYSSLMLTDSIDLGQAHWQINSAGRIVLGVSQGPATRVWTNYASSPVVTPGRFGRWMHLATTFDHRAEVVTHYVDGVAVWSGPVLGRTTLRIGDAELGNWGALGRKPSPIRNLCGRIDEFTLFRDALGPDEVLTLYEQGVPEP